MLLILLNIRKLILEVCDFFVFKILNLFYTLIFNLNFIYHFGFYFFIRGLDEEKLQKETCQHSLR